MLKKHANVQTYEHLLRASVCMYMFVSGPCMVTQLSKFKFMHQMADTVSN